MTRPLGLFDQDIRPPKLASLGDPRVMLNRIVPWDMFRERLETSVGKMPDAKRGGRPRYDVVLMFKILVLRELYALSDEQVEFQVVDWLLFQHFLGIEHAVPDYTAVRRFRERLEGEAMTDLFEVLVAYTDGRQNMAQRNRPLTNQQKT